jgi:hypothetical protein
MHLAFIPYGIKNMVDFVMEDLNHKYLPLKLTKKGEKDKFILIQVQIRVLPLGVYELVFPKEFAEEIFSALDINEEIQYSSEFKKRFLGISPIKTIRKFLKLEPIPKFKRVNYPNFPMPDYKVFVPIIPLGVRYDKDIVEPKGTPYEGWTHEGI